jgi:diadenosine tetraphosphate (Ap4A) HIT family hydrolase
MDTACELCAGPGGELLWRDACCRVVRVTGTEAEAFPGFCRVIWTAHVAELSDLVEADRLHLVRVVNAVERVLLRLLSPDKINLASLGNMVPHLHWHVIPRWRTDSHFPRPIWAAALRAVPPAPTFVDLPALQAALTVELGVSL